MSNRFLVLLAAGLAGYSVSLNEPSTSSLARADEGKAIVQPHEPAIWTLPCSVGAGTRFTARTDRTLGTDSSYPDDPFTARVATRVATSCGSDFISSGALVRGRVARVEHGTAPVLVLELIDADTTAGPKPIAASVRSGGGLAWIETNARSSYPEFDLFPSLSMASALGRDVQLTLPAGSLLEVELIEPVLILP